MVKAAQALDWSRDPSWLMYSGLIGGGLGMGARLVKHLIDQRKPTVKPLHAPGAQLPIEVTPEEALALESRGEDVKTAFEWTGGPTSSAVGGAIRGALGTGAALGGYSLIDSLIDRARKKQMRQDIEHLRGRLSDVLTDSPAPQDVPLHAQMKAAEDVYFAKDASVVANTVDSLLPPSLAALAGGASVLAGIGAFRHVRDENPNTQRMSDLRSLVHPPEGPSKLSLSPVVNKVKLLALLKSRQQPAEVAAIEPPKVDWTSRLEQMHKRQDPDGLVAKKKKLPIVPADAALSDPSAVAEQSMAF